LFSRRIGRQRDKQNCKRINVWPLSVHKTTKTKTKTKKTKTEDRRPKTKDQRPKSKDSKARPRTKLNVKLQMLKRFIRR